MKFVHVLLTSAMLMLLWLPTRMLAQPPAPADTLVVAAGIRHIGDLATFSRTIRVEGEVQGDVTSWNGDIVVLGTVGGDVVSYGGTVILGSAAHITGSVMALTGEVRREATAQIEGRQLTLTPVQVSANVLDLVTPQEIGLNSTLHVAAVGASALLLVALCLLFPSLWPVRSGTTLLMLRLHPWLSLGFGLLTTALLVAGLLLLSMLLALTLIGLLLLAPLLLAAHLIWSYGLAVLAQLVGTTLTRHAPLQASLLGAFLLVVPLVILALVAPLSGLLLFYLLCSAGLGAATLSRGGTVIVGN